MTAIPKRALAGTSLAVPSERRFKTMSTTAWIVVLVLLALLLGGGGYFYRR
jgi:hypothetical protein